MLETFLNFASIELLNSQLCRTHSNRKIDAFPTARRQEIIYLSTDSSL